MAKVALTSMTKKSGDFIAADAIDLNVEDGRFAVLTTTLWMIAGLGEVMKAARYASRGPRG